MKFFPVPFANARHSFAHNGSTNALEISKQLVTKVRAKIHACREREHSYPEPKQACPERQYSCTKAIQAHPAGGEAHLERLKRCVENFQACPAGGQAHLERLKRCVKRFGVRILRSRSRIFGSISCISRSGRRVFGNRVGVLRFVACLPACEVQLARGPVQVVAGQLVMALLLHQLASGLAYLHERSKCPGGGSLPALRHTSINSVCQNQGAWQAGVSGHELKARLFGG